MLGWEALGLACCAFSRVMRCVAPPPICAAWLLLCSGRGAALGLGWALLPPPPAVPAVAAVVAGLAFMPPNRDLLPAAEGRTSGMLVGIVVLGWTSGCRDSKWYEDYVDWPAV